MTSNNANVETIGPNTHGGLGTSPDASPGIPLSESEEQKKPCGLAAVQAKLGLDKAVLIPMFKGSLPPIIGIAMCQSTTVANYFQTLGYLIPIISVLGLAILPRGKFLQNLVLNLFAICFGSAVALLALWSSIQARLHTTPPGQSIIDPLTGTLRYNSSQSAVCAVWLFANIWFVNVLRAKLPSFNVPVILYSILVNVASTFGPRMPSTASAEAFVRELISAMLTGLALATAVNLLVIPISSRMVVQKEFGGAIGLLRKALGLQKKYLVGLEELDMFAVVTNEAMSEAKIQQTEKKRKKTGKSSEEASNESTKEPSMTKEAAIAKELKGAIAEVQAISGKIQADIAFAKRDVAWGNLDAKDLGEIAKLIRNATIPIVGISSIMDIFQRVAERRGWNVNADESPEIAAQKDKEKRVWNEVMKRMHMPFEILSTAIDEGLEHAALRLGITPRPKVAKKGLEAVDVEARGDTLSPGDDGFSEVIKEKLEQFDATKRQALRAWVKERALVRGDEELSSTEARERDQAQLYCLLYMERLMHASGEAMEDLVTFADKKVRDGTMSRKRLIFPSQRRLRKWMVSIFREEDSSAEQSPDVLETGVNVVYVGDRYNKKKNPEHLPATNAWQHFGNMLRKVAAFFPSEEATFGFRVACATLSVGVIAFLEATQAFFIAQRLVWAMIIIAIGMTMTSGQSIFGFFCRVGGTVLAMVFALIEWYIVDEKTPGTIVFLWLSLFCDYYFLVKFPRFTPAVLIMIVTQVLIIGYELQVRKLGPVVAAASGQPYFPTYKLAPYRLATVAAGSLVAFIWTIFPSPLTDRTWLRRDLSATLYLLANYFGAISSTAQSQIDGTAGNPDIPTSPAHELQKIRRQIFGKMMLLLPSMAAHAQWQKWEPTIGGRFPRDTYEDIIKRTTRIMSYLTFMSYTTSHPPTAHVEARKAPKEEEPPVAGQHPEQPSPSSAYSTPEGDEATAGATTVAEPDRAWLNALSSVLREISPSHHNIVSTLMLLSNSIFSGQSLPPFLPVPRPYEMTRALLRLERRYDSRNPEELDDDADLSPLMVIDSRTGTALDSIPRRQFQPGGQGGSGLGGLGLGREHVLDPANVEQPGYAEFAVLEICSTLVSDDLEGLVRAVSGLVGVVDFSYRVDRGSGTSFGAGGDGSPGAYDGKGKVD